MNIVDDLNDFYERYVSSYNDGDLDAYCAFFDVPVSTVSGAGSQAYVSPTEIRGAAEAQQRSFGGSGWSHTVIVAKRIWVLDASLAVVVADLERVNVSGEVYQTARCVYNVARQNDGWKIVTVAESREALPSSDGLLDSRPI